MDWQLHKLHSIGHIVCSKDLEMRINQYIEKYSTCAYIVHH